MNRGARLLALQDIENELREKIGAYKKVQYALQGGSAVRQARAAYEQAEAAERAARARQQTIQLEWQSLLQKLDREDKLLYSGEIKNSKELEALELEVQMLKKQRERMEEQALNLIQEVEELAQRTASARAAYEQIEQAERQHQAALEQQESELKREISKRRRQREKMMEEIASSDLEQYRYVQRLKNDTFAVAELRSGVCTACHIEVSASKRDTVERADKNQLVTCGNCGRILVG